MSELTYKAVLTLTPPEMEGKYTLHLTLHPSDTIVTDGVVKPLGDCTLDELQRYAASEEAAIGEAYAAMTVESLVEADSVSIECDESDFLERVIVIPPATVEEVEESAEPEPIIEEIMVEELPPREEAVAADDEDEEELDIIVTEVAPPVEDDEPDPDITVAEPEPVHEERESADPTSATRDPQPETRTAGILSDNGYPAKSAVAIWLDEGPLRLMQGHARSSLRREVAGVMIGPHPEKQPDGRYVVHVTDMIIAKHTRMAGASVTYTPESWRYINDQLDLMYPDGDHVIVGWYHTHPGFGIFLSNMDLFIHTNFFTQKWHIAYVLDPVGFRSGFFSWDKEQSKVVPYHFPWPEWTSGTSW